MSHPDTLESLWTHVQLETAGAVDDVSTETYGRVRCDQCGRPTVACPCAHLPPHPVDTNGALIVLTHPNEHKRSLATGWILPKCFKRCAVVTKRDPPVAFLQMFANDDDECIDESTSDTKVPPDVPIFLLYPAAHAVDVCEVFVDAKRDVTSDDTNESTQTQTQSEAPTTRKQKELINAWQAMRGASYILIALDSTWRQAREMATASVPKLPRRTKFVKLPAVNASAPGLRRVQKIAIEDNDDAYDSPSSILRVEPEPGCMLTAEACARAMAVLERNTLENINEVLRMGKLCEYSSNASAALSAAVATLRSMAKYQSKHDPAMHPSADKTQSEGKYRQRIAGGQALGVVE